VLAATPYSAYNRIGRMEFTTEVGKPRNPPRAHAIRSRIQIFIARRWFLAALLIALVTGATSASRLGFLIEWRWLRDGVLVAVMFLMAFPLEARSVWKTLCRPLPALVAIGVNLGIIPLMAWLVAPMLGESLGFGLIAAAATPCTLASASVWTRRAGGNDAISLVVTVVTNAACFIVTPAWLWLATGRVVGGNAVSFGSLGQKLAVLAVLPMLVAQAMRGVPRCAAWANRNKGPLGFAAQWGVLTMVLLGAIQMGRSLASQPESAFASRLAATVVAVVGIHVIAFGIGFAAGSRLGFVREDTTAVAFAGSQKTLMIGLQVSIELGASIIPMVAYHVGQLLIDTLFADRIRHHVRSAAEGPATSSAPIGIPRADRGQSP